MDKEFSVSSHGKALARIVLVLALVYLFLVAVELLGTSFKTIGKDASERLVQGLENPVAGLIVGVLATVLVQSSSVTTSTIVALVGEGSLPLSVAVPMIMGANVGTTITNTLVSLAHVTRDDEFRRAFSGATVHDFFNLVERNRHLCPICQFEHDFRSGYSLGIHFDSFYMAVWAKSSIIVCNLRP